jgi:hypothetical protein
MIIGGVGCITGDTIVNFNRAHKGFKQRIDHVYTQLHNDYNDKTKCYNLNIPTYVRSFNGKYIQLHKIKDVIYSGQKEVYELKLISGHKLKCTSEHKIMTDKGMIPLCCLNDTYGVMIDNIKPIRKKQNSYKFVDASLHVNYHPYKNKCSKVEVHRLIYEAYHNGLTFIDFMDIIWNDKSESEKLKFINPSIFYIHHLDENHYNNSIENLKCMSKYEHASLHTKHEGFMPFHQGVPEYKKVESIKYIGLEKTYDIICEEPYHNFVANGVVIHNSSKTCSMVREIVNDTSSKVYFSNIVTKNVPNNILIKPEMIFKKEEISKKRDGTPVYKYHVNKEFWQEAVKKYGSINVVIDEAHSVLNSRRSMSKTTQAVVDWMALLRRVLGSSSSGYGRLFLITQIERRLDIIAKEQATEARFHLCHYQKTCNQCGWTISENNEVSEPVFMCPYCNIELIKHSHIAEIWCFKDYNSFIQWKYLGKGKTYYKHYYVRNLEKVFPLYNTLQWDNLLVDN